MLRLTLEVMNMLARIMGRITLAPVVVACGVALASAAYADDQAGTEATTRAKKHEEAMKKGKTHEDATRVSEPPADAEKVNVRAKKHEEAMKKGMTHEDATRASEAK